MPCIAVAGTAPAVEERPPLRKICDNQLFVKPTDAGKEFIGEYVEAPPYPGAKNSLLIQGQVEDSEWLSELIRITEKELPVPKKKKKKVTSEKR